MQQPVFWFSVINSSHKESAPRTEFVKGWNANDGHQMTLQGMILYRTKETARLPKRYLKFKNHKVTLIKGMTQEINFSEILRAAP
jgi:hypothetical protein